jgi:hypothetical protein
MRSFSLKENKKFKSYLKIENLLPDVKRSRACSSPATAARARPEMSIGDAWRKEKQFSKLIFLRT